MSALPSSIDAPAPIRPSVAELRERFRSGKAALLTHFRESRASAPGATSLLRALAKHVDQTLADLWQHAGMPTAAARPRLAIRTTPIAAAAPSTSAPISRMSE